MKRVPKEIINEMLSILYVNEDKTITDDSSRLALEYAKDQPREYRKILYVGLFKLIRSYMKEQKKLKKREKLLKGDK